jgi:hypothetical protein
MPDPINRYMQWPLKANPDDIFKSETGSTWVFDGCGWVSTCCAPVVPCDPEVDGISVIWEVVGPGGLATGYGASYFTWNSNFNRYDGYLTEPISIQWTGSQWRFILSGTGAIFATSPTSNILDAVWTTLSPFNGKVRVTQIECGLIYKQLCVDTKYLKASPIPFSPRGPFTLYPSGWASIADIMNGAQPIRYEGWDSNNTAIYLDYDSVDAVWYMYDDYGNNWTINAAPNQIALILGSDWLSSIGDVNATFTQGVCNTECYPNRDGITVMYNDGKWNPIYLTWDSSNGRYYSDNQYINELFGWNWVSVQYDSGNDVIKIVVDQGAGPQSIGGNSYTGNFNQRLFNHNWQGDFDVYCGDVGCPRMCATFKGNQTTMVPWGYNSLESLIACNDKFNGWVGWNGTNETIYLTWEPTGPKYLLSVGGYGTVDIGVSSYTPAALVTNSPYNYNPGGISGTLTLTLGDC